MSTALLTGSNSSMVDSNITGKVRLSYARYCSNSSIVDSNDNAVFNLLVEIFVQIPLWSIVTRAFPCRRSGLSQALKFLSMVDSNERADISVSPFCR